MDCYSTTSFVSLLEFRTSHKRTNIETRHCYKTHFLAKERTDQRVFRNSIKSIFFHCSRCHGQSTTRACAETFSVATEEPQLRTYPLRIIIAGAPASGKGTQCKKIAERYGVVHLSTGDMLREAIQNGTELGKTAKQYMDSGRLVPDDLVIDMLKRRLKEEDCTKRGWLLDGFPRTASQAQALLEAKIDPDLVLVLDVPENELIQRVVGRRLDPITGRIYHLQYSPPEDEQVACRLIQRTDDTEEKAKIRLEAFRTHIRAIEEQFSQVVHINGNRLAEHVFWDIVCEIDQVLGTFHEADTNLQPFGILVLGVPGSNKTEYARLIARMSNALLCDVSDLLVRAVYDGDKVIVGNVVRSAVESGERVPDEIVLQLVHEFLSTHDGYKKRVVFCGFPRTLSQIEFLRNYQFRIEQVFLIDTPDEVTLPRLTCHSLPKLHDNGHINGNGCYSIGSELGWNERTRSSYQVVRKRLSSVYSDWDYIQFAFRGRTHVLYSIDSWNYNTKRIEQALRTPPNPVVLRKVTDVTQVESLREYIESGILFAESRMKPLWDSQWNGLMSMEVLRDGDFGISDLIYRWDLAVLDMAIFYLYFYIQRNLLRVILERTAFYVSLAHSIPWVIISAFYGMYHIRSIESTSFMLRCIQMASKISLPLGIVVRGLRFSVGLHWLYILLTLSSLYYTLVTWRRAFISFDMFLGCPRRRKGYLVDIILKVYRLIVLKRH
ncbi:hypothetical protein GpartN1_g960.t1 [Galdieria partita]|uniref:Adenylate kinase n=1 Tax=Galdieria partita TaxID=83374 RepID=A0A9C7PS06_9RHOD|nr:hypothetical protein GpartN1_g960.t1 [Galdieria partita]